MAELPFETKNLIKQFKFNIRTTNDCKYISSGLYRHIKHEALIQDINDMIAEYLRGQIYDDTKVSNPTLTKLRKLPKRIQKEIQRFVIEKRIDGKGINIMIHPDNYRYFLFQIQGPAQTPYEKGIFYVEAFLTKQYPMKPPKVRFLTPIYHPNADKIGRFCLDITKDKWTPALNMRSLCNEIQLTIQYPNPNDPLNVEIADVWKTDSKLAHQTAKEWTMKYAENIEV